MADDLRKYSGERYLKVEDVGDLHPKKTIAGVRENKKFEKLELIFKTGEVLSINATNTNTLLDHYGTNSDNLVDKEVELYVGPIKYNGTDHDVILVSRSRRRTRIRCRTTTFPYRSEEDGMLLDAALGLAQRGMAIFPCRDDEDFVVDVLLEAARHAGLPPLEAQRTIQSGMRGRL
jgi:hypothetical protein